MSLSAPAPRRKLHNRQIVLEGFEREDGLFDVEAELIDTKPYGFEVADRWVGVGDALHHMRARLTVDDNFVIVAAEAVTISGPFTYCTSGADTFGRLVGLQIKAGFMKSVNERIGGVEGCTHIREFIQQMATVIFQTTYPIRAKRAAEAAGKSGEKHPPRLLNTCHAYNSAGEVVKARFPEFYTGKVD
jgi:hypothetical protein